MPLCCGIYFQGTYLVRRSLFYFLCLWLILDLTVIYLINPFNLYFWLLILFYMELDVRNNQYFPWVWLAHGPALVGSFTIAVLFIVLAALDDVFILNFSTEHGVSHASSWAINLFQSLMPFLVMLIDLVVSFKSLKLAHNLRGSKNNIFVPDLATSIKILWVAVAPLAMFCLLNYAFDRTSIASSFTTYSQEDIWLCVSLAWFFSVLVFIVSFYSPTGVSELSNMNGSMMRSLGRVRPHHSHDVLPLVSSGSRVRHDRRLFEPINSSASSSSIFIPSQTPPSTLETPEFYHGPSSNVTYDRSMRYPGRSGKRRESERKSSGNMATSFPMSPMSPISSSEVISRSIATNPQLRSLNLSSALNHFKPLEEALLTDKVLLAAVCLLPNLTSETVSDLVNIFVTHSKLSRLFHVTSLIELQKTATKRMKLFRDDSLTGLFVCNYMRLQHAGLLDRVFGDLIRSFVADPFFIECGATATTCEVDQATASNQEKFALLCTQFLDHLLLSIETLPAEMKWLFHYVWSALVNEGSRPHTIQIASLLYLHVYCPVIVRPHEYHICDEIEEAPSRILKSVSKVMFYVGTEQMFGTKEPLSFMNEFVSENVNRSRERMKQQLLTQHPSSDVFLAGKGSTPIVTDTEESLQRLHRYMWANLLPLQAALSRFKEPDQ